MDKYIKAQDVRDEIEKFIWSPLPKAMSYANFIVERLPAADVVPVRHGKWVKATGMMPPEYCGLHICSECGHYAGRKPPYGGREMLSDYCPNCGAKMDGDRE